MKRSALDFYEEELNNLTVKMTGGNISLGDYSNIKSEIFNQAKNIEINVATEYAEFCVRCDRANLPLLCFEDWKKEVVF